MKTAKKIAFITTILEDWGGSEELWARSIRYLQGYGYHIAVYKEKINRIHPEVRQLITAGVEFIEFDLKEFSIFKKARRRILYHYHRKVIIPYDNDSNLKILLANHNPNLVIISQGMNFDGLGYGYLCSQLNIRYVLISQKAVNFFWPYYKDRNAMREVYINATKSIFISKNNLQLTEEQFGVRFDNAEIHSNPIKVRRSVIPMPESNGIIKFACIGRFFLLDKGQDILIRILAQPKWRERPIKVSFIGSGVDKEGLKEMAELLSVHNVEFLEPIHDIEKLWEEYHALILPSRNEGTPLVLLEAMACGRTAIVSKAGGNNELIKDGYNGFIADSNENDFEKAMECAWNSYDNWEQIGRNAHSFCK